MEDIEAIAWQKAHEDDLWIFDKLIVSRKLGYNCGPAGMNVPTPDNYIVRPCVNIPGMSKGAKFLKLEKETDHLPPGYFWCEIFKGRHLSIDYKNGKQVLAVEGFRNKENELWKFSKWKKVDDLVPLPSIFYSLILKYEYINIEFIDNKPIEIHLRHNPDFVWGNSVAIPIWLGDDIANSVPDYEEESFLRFVNAPDQNRKGFWID